MGGAVGLSPCPLQCIGVPVHLKDREQSMSCKGGARKKIKGKEKVRP